jgi:hypothetical protein
MLVAHHLCQRRFSQVPAVKTVAWIVVPDVVREDGEILCRAYRGKREKAEEDGPAHA